MNSSRWFVSKASLLLVWLTLSCGNWPIEPPPPPPPPPTTTSTTSTTTTTTPVTTTTTSTTTTIDDIQAKDYYTLDLAGTLPADYTQDCRDATGMVLKLCVQRQELIWQGYRGPNKARYDCRDELHVIGVDPEDLDALVERVEGPEGLLARLDRFIVRLPMENSDFPGRSVVRKEYYRAFQNDLVAHLEEAGIYNDATQTDPCRQTEAYDNLQGWCEKCYAN